MLCLGFLCVFCFLFFLGGITGYATWTVSCPRLILGLVWEWDYRVLPGQKGFCLTVAESSSKFQLPCKDKSFCGKEAEDMVVLSV